MRKPHSGVSIQAVGARHQRLNFGERSYQDFKALMEAMRKDTSRSIYDQGETLVEIQRKFKLVTSVINSTPLLVKYSDAEECIVMKEALLTPTLDERMSDILAGASGAHDGMFADVLKYNATIRENVKLKVRSYLQEKGVSYPDQRKGKHQEDSEMILPLTQLDW